MKRLLSVLVILTLLSSLSLAAVVPAFSDTEGTVTVTIESATVSVVVIPSSVNYGVVGLGMTGVVPHGDPMIRVQNTGNWWASFQIRGDDTTGGWILSDAAEPDRYVHYFGQGAPTMVYSPLDVSYQGLGGASYSPGIGPFFKLKMDTPTSSNFMGTQSTTVTVMVTQENEGLQLILETDSDTYEQETGPALLSANVTNQSGTPVSSLTSFLVVISQGDPPTPGIPPVIVQPITLTETGTGTGTYTGTLDISSLVAGIYTVGVHTNDGSHFAAGGHPITITP